MDFLEQLMFQVYRNLVANDCLYSPVEQLWAFSVCLCRGSEGSDSVFAAFFSLSDLFLFLSLSGRQWTCSWSSPSWASAASTLSSSVTISSRSLSHMPTCTFVTFKVTKSSVRWLHRLSCRLLHVQPLHVIVCCVKVPFESLRLVTFDLWNLK